MSKFTQAQQQAVQTLTGNLAVTAGAGAGKTRVLVERYLNLLKQKKAACDQIVAITFTKKAAKEMKERVRQELDQQIVRTAGEEKLFWFETKERFEYAPISTFHSFCGRILREYPVETNLDPNFAVLDEMETQIMAQETLQNVLETAAQTRQEWMGPLFHLFDLQQIYELIPGVYDKLVEGGYFDQGDLQANLAKPYETALTKVPALREICSNQVRDCWALLKQKKTKSTKVMAVTEEETLGAIKALEQEGDQAHEILQRFFKSFQGRNDLKGPKQAGQEALKQLVQHLKCVQAISGLNPLSQLLKAYDNVLTGRKQEEQVLTYQDLEQKTLRLLQQQARVVACLQEKYPYIMVDEFQDTNEVQRKLLYLLAGGTTEKLNSGNLFVVGDAKQSIYRFRGANVAVFAQVCQDIVQQEGQQIELDTNFRSQAGLVEWFNSFFDLLMPAQDPVSFSPLQAGSSERNPEPACELLITAKDYFENPHNLRQAEARAIAERIQELSGTVNDQGQKVQFGHMVILLRSFSDVDLYAWELQQAQIPFYVLSGKGFFSCQEIRDVLNLLRLVDNPQSELAWAGVLRSPLQSLPDQDLWQLRQAQSLWQALQTTQAENLKALNHKIQDWHKLSQQKGLSEIVRLVIVASGYEQFVLTQFMGHQKRANLQKLTALAKEFEQRDFHGLHDFLMQVERWIELAAREGEAQIESEQGNSVKIMTIHKSKGLEFPIVFIPDLQRKLQVQQPRLCVSATLGLAIAAEQKAGQEPNAVYAAQCEAERILDWQEMKRLFYVAATRAEERLILSGIAPARSSTGSEPKTLAEGHSWLDWILTSLGVNHPSEMAEIMELRGQPVRIIRYGPQPNKLVKPNRPLLKTKRERWVKQISQQEQKLAQEWQNLIAPIAEQKPDGPELLSATALRRFRTCPRAFFLQYIAKIPISQPASPVSTTEAAALFDTDRKLSAADRGRLMGNILHDCCEHDHGNQTEDLVEQALQRQAPLAYRPELRQEAQALWSRVQQSLSYGQLCSQPYESEWAFLYDLQGTFVQGSIDRLIFYPSGSLGIVDFKTDHVNWQDENSIRQKVAAYEEQCLLYALVASELFGRPVEKVMLYFIRQTKIQLIPMNQLELAKNRLLEACKYIQNHSRQDQYPCNIELCKHCLIQQICNRLSRLADL